MKKKSLIMLLCTVLVITTVAMGTIAYLTDSKSVTNVFTVGNVSIKLDEAKVNPDGTPVEPNERTEEGNTYHLIPGITYTKDPTVSVQGKSEEAYIRMLVEVTDMQDVIRVFGEDFDLDTIIDGHDENAWIRADKTVDVENDKIVYEYRYAQTVDTMDKEAEAVETLKPLFTSFTVPTYLDGEDLAAIDDMEIVVTGQAIQSATFNNADEAWAGLKAQMEANQ